MCGFVGEIHLHAGEVIDGPGNGKKEFQEGSMKKIWMKGMMALGLVLGLGLAQTLRADMDEKKGMEPPKMPAEFDKLKALVGTWKGTAVKNGKTMEVTNTFQLTSGGSAIIEKIGEGADNEMISVYCAEGGKMTMTHYCSVGNHPKMVLKKTGDNEMDFEMKGTTGLGSAKEMHMHGMTITWKDADHITESWYLYSGGKKQASCPFELTRVKK